MADGAVADTLQSAAKPRRGGLGYIDVIRDRKVIGWATDGGLEPVVVELFADGLIIGEALANVYREDLARIGFGDGCRGWAIEIPEDLSLRPYLFSARIKTNGHELPNNIVKKQPGFGFIDKISNSQAVGWASDGGKSPVVVELLVNGTVVGEALADTYREDLEHVGHGDGRRGWAIGIPPAMWRDARSVSARIKTTGHVLPNNAVKHAHRHSLNYINSTMLGKPEPETGFTSREPDNFDIEIAKEIIKIAKTIPAYEVTPGFMWDRHTNWHQMGFAELLQKGDAEPLAAFLVLLATKKETTGFLQGEEAYLALAATSSLGRSVAEGPAKDALVSLAQYLSVERIESVEVGPFGEAILKDQRTIAKQVEEVLGISLAPPVVFDKLLGLKIDSGILDRRAIQALYAAHRLLSLTGKPGGNFCEIGGGIGLAAYYTMILGARSCAIVDLPNMSLFQYYYLRRALPDRKVSIITANTQPRADVNLIPASVYFDLDRSWTWDAYLNCDSFPEMGDDVCLKYIADIYQRTKHLLSINQEGGCPLTPNARGPRQTVVPELLKGNPHYRKLYRMRSWVRHGFGEEVYATAA